MPGYRTVGDVPTRFRDTDAMGHVNNAVYLSYLEQARVEYMRDVFGVTKVEEFGIIVARVEIDYRSPVLMGENLLVGIRTSSVGGASFEAEYRVVEKGSGRLVADAKSVQVRYDYKSGRVQKLSPDFSRKLKEHDGLA
jgi:acyl-CoA thioester hydrolase